jgi:hypothetical protein
VHTAQADVMVALGDFTVSVRGDTTDVAVGVPSKRAFIASAPLYTSAFLSDRSGASPLQVAETELARVVRGGTAQKLRAVPGQGGAPAITGVSPGGLPTAEQETYASAIGGDIILRDSTRVTLAAGARISTPLVVRPGDVFTATFTGSARFTVTPPRQALAAAFALEMPATYIVTSHAEFSVTTRGDTVDVAVFHRKRNARTDPPPGRANVVSISGVDRLIGVLTVRAGHRARVVRGSKPRLLP